MKRDDLLELIPAYAIGALDEEERIQIEALLKDDAEAMALLDEYETMASIFAFAVPERPAPAHLRDDLKNRLKEQRQNSVNEQSESKETVKSAEPDAEQAKIVRFPMISVLTGIAAVMIVLVGFVYLVSSGAFDLNTNTLSADELLYNEIISDSESTSIAALPVLGENVDGEIVFTADGNQAVLRIAQLPEKTEDESYQLWAISDDVGLRSLGIFYWDDAVGPHYIEIEDTKDNLVVVAMTIEPFDGSPLIDSPTGGHLFDVFVEENR